MREPQPAPPRPRIGVDYGPALAHGPGVGRYARELVRALVRLEHGPRLSLLDLWRAERPYDARTAGLIGAPNPVRRITLPVPRRALALAGRLGLGAERLLGGIDLFHDLRPEPLPVRRARRTWALSELPPEGSPAEARLRQHARSMDGLIAFSSHGAALFAERLDVPPERVHRTPVGAEHFARDLRGSPADDGPPYVLALGRIDRRRSPLELLRAVETLHAGGLEVGLRFVGRPGDGAARLEAALLRSPLGAAARWLRDPDEALLPGLIAGAGALCHLAERELTAVTPLEALATGVPVVASRLPAFEEALGEGARWVAAPREREDAETPDPARVTALAEALADALGERHDPAALAARRARAAPFTWEACARATATVWERVLDPR